MVVELTRVVKSLGTPMMKRMMIPWGQPVDPLNPVRIDSTVS